MGKLVVLAVGVTGVVVGAGLSSWTAGVIGVAAVSFIVIPRVEEWWRRRRLVRRAALRSPGAADPQILQRALETIGLGPAERTELIAEASRGDVLLGTFTQDDRVATELALAGGLVTVVQPAAEARSRHDVRLMIAHGRLCVRKEFRNYKDRPLRRLWFSQEVAALERLRGVEAVPRLIAVEPSVPAAYLSFLSGPSLATLLEDRGVSQKDQFRVRGVYPGPGRWSSEDDSDLRLRAVGAMRSIVGEHGLERLRALIDRIHDRGVVMGDVKYGNVLVRDEGPALIDFDLARVHRPRSASMYIAREREMDLCSYMFGFR